MAKNTKCPVCKKEIEKHVITAALECVNELGLQEDVITLDDTLAAGRLFGDLKGWGQKHGDKNKWTLNIKGKEVVTIEPELVVLQDILQKQSKPEPKEKEDEQGSEGTDSESIEAPADSEGSPS